MADNVINISANIPNYLGVQMKIFPILGCLALALLLSVSAMAQAADESVTVQLGKRSIRIPAPAGFVDGATRYPQIKERFQATEDPRNEMLAVHIERSTSEAIEKGGVDGLAFYTKVSVPRAYSTVDLPDDMIEGVALAYEKQAAKVFDPKGPELKRITDTIQKGLSSTEGRDISVTAPAITELGRLEKSKNSFTTMILIDSVIDGKRSVYAGSISFLNVNRRMIYVYAYKEYKAKNDLEELGTFAKKWTADILAANK